MHVYIHRVSAATSLLLLYGTHNSRAPQYSRTWPEVWLSTTALRVNRGSRRASRVERRALAALLEAGVATERAPPSEYPVPPSRRCCLADLKKEVVAFIHSTRDTIFFVAPEVKHQMFTGRTLLILQQ